MVDDIITDASTSNENVREMRSKTRKVNKKEKKLTVFDQMAMEAYKTKKENSKIEGASGTSLKSFKGVKASDSTSSGARNDFKKNSKGVEAVRNKQTNKRSIASPKSRKPSNAKDRSKGKESGRPKAPSKSQQSSGRKDQPRNKEVVKCKQSNNNNDNDNNNNNNNDTNNNKEKSSIKSKESVNSKKPLKTDGTKSSRQATKSRHEDKTKQAARPKIVDTATKGNNGRPGNKKGRADIRSTQPSNLKRDGNSNSKTSTKVKQSAQPKKIEHTHYSSANDSNENYVEEGEVIRNYTKYVPKKSYPDLKTYFDEYSFALFLEQKLENEFISDFKVVWPKNKSEKTFVVIVKQKSPELESLLPPNMAKLGRLPFTIQQPLMLTTQDEDKVWYSYVKELQASKGNFMMLMELYPWNHLELPCQLSNGMLKILPCNHQVNRIMFAMTRVKNPAFVDLILGQKPIKNLSFQNRIKFSKETLNDSQKNAVQNVLNNQITVIQGPPGTGKTSTIEEIIIQLITSLHSFPILCVAASNIAIDNIAEKFMNSEFKHKMVRICSMNKQSQYDQNHPLGEICLHNMVNQKLSSNSKEVVHKLKTGQFNSFSKNAYNKFLTEQNNISDRIVSQAQLIFTTNIASGGRQLKSIKELPVVIMDESTQSSEAHTLVPLSLPGIRKFVFVGDEKQLSSFSNVPQLEMSLFERILTNGTCAKSHMLDIQYRMHPKISSFPIEEFYHGALKDGVTNDDKFWPNIAYPLYWYDIPHGKESSIFRRAKGNSGFSYVNEEQAKAVTTIVQKLIMEKDVPRDEIGVITPYSAQRDFISNLMIADPIINPAKIDLIREMDRDESLDSGAANKNTMNIVNDVFVSSIDSFQGHEKKFIIFSCVRNNEENKVGFVRDRRRLNVALTRAKNGLIIVGAKDVMKAGDPLWQKYIEYLEANDLIFKNLDDY